MNYLMHYAWAQLRIKYALLAILGVFFYFHTPTATAQTTSDTTWHTPSPTISSTRALNSWGASTSAVTSSTNGFSAPVHLAYRMPVMVDDVIIDQVAGSNLNYAFSWYANPWFNRLDIYISGITNNDLENLLVGIVITIDDIRGSEQILFPQLDIEQLRMQPYPNPNRGELQLDIQGNESQPMNLKVLDLQGRCVLNQTIQPVNEFMKLPVSLEGINPGSYWILLQGSSQVIKPIQVIR